MKRYRRTDRGKAAQARYDNSAKGKATRKKRKKLKP